VEKLFDDYKYRNPRMLLRNLGGGKLENASTSSGPGVTDPHSSRGCAFGDFDNDGDVDIVIMNMSEPPSLLRNDTRNGNHWLKLKLIGTVSNRSAIGASVVITAGGKRQRQDVLSQSSFYSQSDLRLHFGLGSAAAAETVEIRWPLGRMQTLHNVQADRILTIREPDKP
jgi:hypothetical protein